MKSLIAISLMILTTFTFHSFADDVHMDVIYGDDNRQDLYQVEDPAIVALAHSTVALVRRSNLSEQSQHFALSTKHYGSSYRLCTTEPFYEQYTGAFCSGFLVNDNTVVTAGHCIMTQSDCDLTSFVFDFAIATEHAGTPQQIEKNNVYHCKKVIHSEAVGNKADFAVIELDRDVTGRTPVTVRTQGTPAIGDALMVIGHPAGLPTKVAGGANVRSLANGFFVANLDTYGGNSGSAVFNSLSGHVEGILVRGEMDYTYKDGCQVSNVCGSNGCRGEDVTFIKKTLPYFQPPQ